MTRYQCIREILDSFDFYDSYAARLGLEEEKAFRIRLYEVNFARNIIEPGDSVGSRRTIFQRVYRAYVFRGVREGHEAGLDYLSICYAFCRRLATTGVDNRWGRFSMHTWACLKTAQPLYNAADKAIGNPEKVSLKQKLAFLREERLKRKFCKENNREFCA